MSPTPGAKLSLTPAEVLYLATTLPPDATWPDEAHHHLLQQLPAPEVAGGPWLRILLIAAQLRQPPGGLDFAPTPAELWLLDAALVAADLRREKLPDGQPLLLLAMKIWSLLLDVYAEELPPQLRKESPDAQSRSSPNEHTHIDAGAAVDSAEALLRSTHREGTSEDLPPAAA